jgi:hypothetical protein
MYIHTCMHTYIQWIYIHTYIHTYTGSFQYTYRANKWDRKYTQGLVNILGSADPAVTYEKAEWMLLLRAHCAERGPSSVINDTHLIYTGFEYLSEEAKLHSITVMLSDSATMIDYGLAKMERNAVMAFHKMTGFMIDQARHYQDLYRQ